MILCNSVRAGLSPHPTGWGLFPLGIVVTSHRNVLSLTGTVRGFSGSCDGKEIREDQGRQTMGPRCRSGARMQSHRVTFRTGNSGEAQALRTEKARTLVEEARRRGPVKKREMVLSREEKHRQGWPVPRGERGQGPPLVRDGAVLGFSAPALLTLGMQHSLGAMGGGSSYAPSHWMPGPPSS